jgi:hypothetical protein
MHKLWLTRDGSVLASTVPRRRQQVLPGDQLHLRHPPGVAVDELMISDTPIAFALKGGLLLWALLHFSFHGRADHPFRLCFDFFMCLFVLLLGYFPSSACARVCEYPSMCRMSFLCVNRIVLRCCCQVCERTIELVVELSDESRAMPSSSL